MRQAGFGARPVGRLHLSDRWYWGLNFKFPNFLCFWGPFDPNFGLVQPMRPKWTCCPQFLCIPSENVFGNLTDLLMSPKTFVSNMIISKKSFRIFKTEQKVKKWKILFLVSTLRTGIFTVHGLKEVAAQATQIVDKVIGIEISVLSFIAV